MCCAPFRMRNLLKKTATELRTGVMQISTCLVRNARINNGRKGPGVKKMFRIMTLYSELIPSSKSELGYVSLEYSKRKKIALDENTRSLDVVLDAV